MADTEPYIVVEDVMGTLGGTLARGMPDANAQASAAQKLDETIIQVAELTPREARAIDNSPLMIAAKLMPTRLLHGLQRDGDQWIASNGEAVPPAANGAPLEVSWGIAAVGADTAHAGGASATVAMLDTGIADHDAFDGIDIDTHNFTTSGNDDVQGHGTHCAGTIFGRDCLGHRIGVARGVRKAFIAKVLDDNGHGTSDWLLQGIKWALDKRADVISISIGYDFPGMVKKLAERMPVDLATSHALVAYRQNLRAFDAIMGLVRAMAGSESGSVIVAATGNESHAEIDPRFRVDATLPASAQDVVAVAAAELRDGQFRIADFSNAAPIITAPGVDIVSARPDGTFAKMSGTSMACPHAAGIAALWWDHLRAQAGDVSARQVAARLSASARNNVFVPGFSRTEFGDGLATAP